MPYGISGRRYSISKLIDSHGYGGNLARYVRRARLGMAAQNKGAELGFEQNANSSVFPTTIALLRAEKCSTGEHFADAHAIFMPWLQASKVK
jgi:hypothetical protein